MNVEIDLGGIIWLALLIFGLAGVAPRPPEPPPCWYSR